MRVFSIFCTYISEGFFKPHFNKSREKVQTKCTKRVALVKKRVRENTRRRQWRGIYGLSAACMLLFAVMMQAADVFAVQEQTAAWGVFGAMLLREDAGGYVLVAVVSFAAAVVVTVFCTRLRKNNKQQEQTKEDEET